VRNKERGVEEDDWVLNCLVGERATKATKVAGKDGSSSGKKEKRKLGGAVCEGGV